MKWLVRWFIKQAQKVDAEDRENRIYGGSLSTAKVARASDVDADEGLNIIVRKAMGGKIVTFRTYDHKMDRNNHKLYVIPDDQDFEKELGKLITLESMRM